MLPEPEPINFTIEEALSYLAFGHAFNSADFRSAGDYVDRRGEFVGLAEDWVAVAESGVESRTKKLTYLQEELERQKSDWEDARPAPSRPGEDDDALVRELSDLLSFHKWGVSRPAALNEMEVEIQELKVELSALAHLSSQGRQAERVISRMTEAAGGRQFGSQEFWKMLERAQTHLWDAIQAGKIVVRGKPDAGAIEWLNIPPSWFEHESKPNCILGGNAIGRDCGPAGLIPKWYDIRLNRRAVDEFRTSLQPENKLKAGTVTATTSHAKLVQKNGSEPLDERIKCILRGIEPAMIGYRPTYKESERALKMHGINLSRRELREHMNALDLKPKSGPRKIQK